MLAQTMLAYSRKSTDWWPARSFLRVLVAFACSLLLRATKTNHHATKVWQSRLINRGTEPTTAAIHQSFEQPFAVHMLLNPSFASFLTQRENHFRLQDQHAYVGSTTCTVNKRQDARIRKLRQVEKRQPVSAELAIHWMHAEVRSVCNFARADFRHHVAV